MDNNRPFVCLSVFWDAYSYRELSLVDRTFLSNTPHFFHPDFCHFPIQNLFPKKSDLEGQNPEAGPGVGEFMRLIFLDTFWTIVLDFLIWGVIHLGVVFVMTRFSDKGFNPRRWLFLPRPWEREGLLYEEILKIKKWKEYLPDGARVTKKRGFPKKRLQERSSPYLNLFVRETCRAELTHWIIMLFAPFFFLWNKTWVGFIMTIYALAENLPLIMAQRYNRLRLLRVLSKKTSEGKGPEGVF
jgi:glycosyl-4,4'-diaponeurosporenoate acyltransferase